MRTPYIVIFCLLAVIAGFSYGRYYPSSVLQQDYHEPAGYVFVYIDGNVEKPGRYLVKEGEILDEVVKISGPRDLMEIRGKKWKKAVKSGQRVFVGKKSRKRT